MKARQRNRKRRKRLQQAFRLVCRKREVFRKRQIKETEKEHPLRTQVAETDPISSTQRPADYFDGEKKNHEQTYRFLRSAARSARRAIRFDGHASRRLNLPYLIAFMSDCSARLEWQLSWEIDDGSVCNSTSPWRASSVWLDIAIISVRGLDGGTSLIEELV